MGPVPANGVPTPTPTPTPAAVASKASGKAVASYAAAASHATLQAAGAHGQYGNAASQSFVGSLSPNEIDALFGGGGSAGMGGGTAFNGIPNLQAVAAALAGPGSKRAHGTGSGAFGGAAAGSAAQTHGSHAKRQKLAAGPAAAQAAQAAQAGGTGGRWEIRVNTPGADWQPLDSTTCTLLTNAKRANPVNAYFPPYTPGHIPYYGSVWVDFARGVIQSSQGALVRGCKIRQVPGPSLQGSGLTVVPERHRGARKRAVT